MKKILSVVGARPQFIKAAALSRVLRKDFTEILVHTGQHYDKNMSDVFFEQLQIPKPDYHLEVGSGSHGKQTGLMLQCLEQVMMKENPDLVIIYGDTNSTLAGALCASKLQIPLAHVEAGLRSYNWSMPEEINRVLSDRCSQLLFCPTQTACENLEKENITKGVFQTGDVMFDASLAFAQLAEETSVILDQLRVEPKQYTLCTIHRASNTDELKTLQGIFKALLKSPVPVVFPIHPRTLKMAEKFELLSDLKASDRIILLDPVDYLDMVQLEKNAAFIITDSGGIQKEAYFYQVPCLTLREETEWVETVEDGWNQIVGTNMHSIVNSMNAIQLPDKTSQYYGSGNACDNILQLIHEFM